MVCALLFLVLCSPGCKPVVEVSDATDLTLPECQGYKVKHTLDDVGYLTVTVVSPPSDKGEARSSLLTFHQRSDGIYFLDNASKRVVVDTLPLRDTQARLSPQALCLTAGPGDTSADPCLGAWLTRSAKGEVCQPTH